MLTDERMMNLAKLLDVSALRARVHAGNIANVNTPGYRARAVNFESAFQEAMAKGDGNQARAIEAEIYEPRTTSVDNDGNDVSLDHEITMASENALLYQTYIQMLRGKHRLMTTAIRSQGG